jgi:hypothetical protein
MFVTRNEKFIQMFNSLLNFWDGLGPVALKDKLPLKILRCVFHSKYEENLISVFFTTSVL